MMLLNALYHVIWNPIPCYLESCSNLTGTSFQLIWNTVPSKQNQGVLL